jgi:hypothetical protein
MIRHGKVLLRGNPEELTNEIRRCGSATLFAYSGIISIGCGVYGCTVGLWRSPLQSLFTAIKFPLLIFLTCAGNALVNGMLAQVLGSGLSMRQTFCAILMSFAVASVVLVGLSPITCFVVLNAPDLASDRKVIGHSVVLLTHVLVISYAGIVANRHLLRVLVRTSDTPVRATAVLFGWLTGNLFLGAQLAWVLRPFIGSPQLGVAFLRQDPLRGNFYEAVWRALVHIFT